MSEPMASWAGARWWKVDFHTHTPKSSDYGKGPDQQELQERSPQAWLLDFMAAEIDCVVVTDHNSGAWIDLLKDELEKLKAKREVGFRPLIIFPGVEISVLGGVHILAVLNDTCGTTDVDTLLGTVGYRGTKGTCDAVTDKSVAEVVKEIDKIGGIAIPAHVDGPKGLFTAQQGKTLQQTCECPEVFTMEILDTSMSKPQVYLDAKLHWTEVIGSDAHHPRGSQGKNYPGSHFTWVKMSEPSLDGLRLALLDGVLSVKRSDKTLDDPNVHGALMLESFDVSNARYMGRGQPLSLTFGPWLNAIIGGRGTGKSTLIELMRLTLRRDDEIPNALKDELAKYRKTYHHRDDDGLLTDNTKLVLIYRKDGARFKVQWSPGGDVEPILSEEEDGNWASADGEIRSRFPVRIYSQKQVYQLASQTGALLRMIDDAPEMGQTSWNERWRQEENKYLALRANVRKFASDVAEERRIVGELDDVKRKLTVFERADHADVLKDYQRRRRQLRAVQLWEQGWEAVGAQIQRVASDVTPGSLQGSTFSDDRPAEAAFRAIGEDVRRQLDKIQMKLEVLAKEAVAVSADWQRKRDASDWKQLVTTAEDAYRALERALAEQGAGDPAAYGQLVQDRQTLEHRLQQLAEQRVHARELESAADESVQRLKCLRRELSEARRRFLSNTLEGNQYVKITVIPYGARDQVESQIRRIISREDGGFRKDIGAPDGDKGLLAGLYASSNMSEDIERNIDVFKGDMRAIADRRAKAPSVDKRFAAHLEKLNPEALDRLDIWFPEDSLDVQYSVSSDGRNFRSIREGSPGQKTAALLAFLLSYGKEPLILDQPEDDLDNRLIYELIVTQLRQVKTYRQLIIVTHNANIVVNGDAELVVALHSKNGQTHQEARGSLQELGVRKTICEVMEGGREAFERRYRRIVIESRHD